MEVGPTDTTIAALRAQSFVNCQDRTTMGDRLHYKCGHCPAVIDMLDINSIQKMRDHLEIVHNGEEMLVEYWKPLNLLTQWAAETLVAFSTAPMYFPRPVARPSPCLRGMTQSSEQENLTLPPSDIPSTSVDGNFSLQQSPLVDNMDATPLVTSGHRLKQIHNCRKCKDHGVTARIKGHNCSFDDCRCIVCLKVDKTRQKWRASNAVNKKRNSEADQ